MTFPGIEVTSVGSNNDFTSPLNLDPDPDCASISSRGTSSTVGYRYTGGFLCTTGQGRDGEIRTYHYEMGKCLTGAIISVSEPLNLELIYRHQMKECLSSFNL